MKTKIIFHVDETVNFKTRMESGCLIYQEDSLRFEGACSFEVPFASLISAAAFPQNGFVKMIKLTCAERTIILSVVRFSIGGHFAASTIPDWGNSRRDWKF